MSSRIIGSAAVAAAYLVVLSGQARVPSQKEAPPKSQADAKKPTRPALERTFKETLTGSVLSGTWQMIKDGEKSLTPPRPDRYSIDQVSKASGDYWVITARIQYGEKDVRIPITVRVVFAGDTPVITLDEMNLPGLGVYSARVMVYRDYYAGTWFGCGYGGVLSGQITKASDEKPATTQPSEDKD